MATAKITSRIPIAGILAETRFKEKARAGRRDGKTNAGMRQGKRSEAIKTADPMNGVIQRMCRQRN